MKGELFTKAIESVTDDWRKQRQREDRGWPEVKQRRRRVMSCNEYEYSTRVTITDAANECMEAAYMKASAGGTLPAAARQIMYAARPTILANARDRHGNPLQLRSEYFTQTLLPDYMREFGCEDWDVVFDARGHLSEPHTKKTVPLGTLDVRRYLRNAAHGGNDDISYEEVDREYPTCGPDGRYSAILFIEKEGFLPLFNAVNLAKRYDIAIMSTKGMSVVAARSLVENICGDFDIPLLVLRDFDKAGFTIAATLRRDTKRFQFSKDFDCVDLGLRLEDVKKWDLSSEEVFYNSNPRRDLKKNGATPEEIDFLHEGGSKKRHYGRRVELNAFSSDAFIRWIESKLEQQGIKKVIPDTGTLKGAYARAIKVATVNKAIEDALGDADEAAESHVMPKTLIQQIRRRLKKNPELPWDQVVAEVAAKKINE